MFWFIFYWNNGIVYNIQIIALLFEFDSRNTSRSTVIGKLSIVCVINVDNNITKCSKQFVFHLEKHFKMVCITNISEFWMDLEF